MSVIEHYRVRSFLGLLKRIVYKCPSCKNELESKWSDAGQEDSCPLCLTSFLVPGAEEKLRKERENQARREASRKEKEARRAAEMALRIERAKAEVLEKQILLESRKIGGCNSCDVEVVGESKYQPSINKAIKKSKDSNYDNRWYLEAELVLEDSNPYDSNAVQVRLFGKTCGYLSRGNAKRFRKKLQEHEFVGTKFTCDAVVVRGRSEDAMCGIWLDLYELGM